MPARISYEPTRGCGRRKEGGLYLVSPPRGFRCGRFPIPVSVCPTCGAGIRPARGFTWVDGDDFRHMAPACPLVPGVGCHESCVMRPDGPPIGRAGLLWIGTRYYPTPESFQREGQAIGFSRRLPGNVLPRGFQIGETWVFLGHRYAVAPWEQPGWERREGEALVMTPGIFAVWQPSAVECIVPEQSEWDDAMVAKVQRLERRGIQPVIVREPQVGIEEVIEIASRGVVPDESAEPTA